jgi:predicted nucleic acid-binding protein
LTSAYVDTSCIVAAAFGEREAGVVTRRLARFDRVFSSPLLEAELYSALVREDREIVDTWSTAIDYVIADRPLGPEVRRVLEAGYVRGAGCWHLATALYLAPDPGKLAFVTLDASQRTVARTLGFVT